MLFFAQSNLKLFSFLTKTTPPEWFCCQGIQGTETITSMSFGLEGNKWRPSAYYKAGGEQN